MPRLRLLVRSVRSPTSTTAAREIPTVVPFFSGPSGKGPQGHGEKFALPLSVWGPLRSARGAREGKRPTPPCSRKLAPSEESAAAVAALAVGTHSPSPVRLPATKTGFWPHRKPYGGPTQWALCGWRSGSTRCFSWSRVFGSICENPGGGVCVPVNGISVGGGGDSGGTAAIAGELWFMEIQTTTTTAAAAAQWETLRCNLGIAFLQRVGD
ncbi:unnamed protein product [Ectocarpus sp. 4 AP-2014]